MTFQSPVTVAEVLEQIHHKKYLLPAIQREFVWKPNQILGLIDSLMRGYPIGSFLLWEIPEQNTSKYAFYDFITHYHERNSPYATKTSIPAGRGITAILDGQQRLTSLNIAFYGSHAVKRSHAWASNPSAYPKRRVYLNLASSPDHQELGLRYDLRFLANDEAVDSETAVWFPVGNILHLQDSGPSIMRELELRGLSGSEPFERMYKLYEAVRVSKPINWYLEKSADADMVLDIFVRVNSGGTTLSHSDLLLSLATNQWDHRDAREEVRELVTEINQGGSREFRFSRDTVLKSALMVADLDTRFNVSNFTKKNMAKVEASWDKTREAILSAAELLQTFGYSAKSITADSVLIALTYFMATNNHGSRYVESLRQGADHDTVRGWLARTFLKSGVWGSGLDTLLGRIREAIRSNPGDFPVAAIEKEMSSMGKTLTFDETEIDDILNAQFGTARAYTALSLLYPGVDVSKQYHVDHIFPKSRFTQRRLAELGVDRDAAEQLIERVNSLPNLQLLGGIANTEKLDSLPSDWVATAFSTDDKRSTYLRENDLDGLALDFPSFLETFESRKARMKQRLVRVLDRRA